MNKQMHIAQEKEKDSQKNDKEFIKSANRSHYNGEQMQIIYYPKRVIISLIESNPTLRLGL